MTQEASKAPEAQEKKLCKKHEFPKCPIKLEQVTTKLVVANLTADQLQS